MIHTIQMDITDDTDGSKIDFDSDGDTVVICVRDENDVRLLNLKLNRTQAMGIAVRVIRAYAIYGEPQMRLSKLNTHVMLHDLDWDD